MNETEIIILLKWLIEYAKKITQMNSINLNFLNT